MSLRPWLRLARIPNVFTAMANVVAGVALARDGAFLQRDLALVAASGALYTAGMVWNDFFDRAIDARERPDRPIPAGEVSASGAAWLGALLLALGLGLAALHGTLPFAVATALGLCVLSYDAWLKHGALGPWAMGACRGLNGLLGLCVLPWPALPRFGALTILFAFTLLITRLSRFEVFGTAVERLRGTIWSFAGLGVCWLAALAWLANSVALGPLALFTLAAACAFVWVRARALFAPLLREVTPPGLGRAIGGGILLMPALDASFVAASGAPLMAAAVFALTLPAYWLKRWYYLT